MEAIETAGTVIDTVDVTISYQIIELVSAGLYSSPNKAFEELVCNSYDAFANFVSVYVPSDLTVENAYMWVCDNGESMDQLGLKELWKIADSSKRNSDRDQRRLQIGKFGIGKLATYVLANKLTYVCKKNGRYLAVTMNFRDIGNSTDPIKLSEREISSKEAEEILTPFLKNHEKNLTPFALFGVDAQESWTFTILRELKPKAIEIKDGRLKWILETALPLNPNFKLYYNGNILESSKISRPLLKSWIIGKDDKTAERLKNIVVREEGANHYLDFENLKGVYGEIELYEDSLADSSKSSEVGRSHGIFLMVRGRLINLDDPLLGLDAISHGPFNRTRFIVHADELDSNLTSTRESVRESVPLTQLKDYIKSKFNREINKFYYDERKRNAELNSIPYRLAQTSLTSSKRPLYIFAERYYRDEIFNPILIKKPNQASKDFLLNALKNDVSSDASIVKSVSWEILNAYEPIATFDLETGMVVINLMHPYIANYNDAYKSTLPLQFIAITEVLLEAHLYELGIDESIVNDIIKRRDSLLRELSLSDRKGVVVVAQILKDSLGDEKGLEDAVHEAFLSLGFESTKIGGAGKPDGKANAILGYDSNNKNENYSLTFEAKSTGSSKIKANTANLATVVKHKTEFGANFAVLVAREFEGGENESSSISVMARQQKVTMIKARDLTRLLLLYAPKQIGLKKMRSLFETCFSPLQVSKWIDDVQEEHVDIGPIRLLLETIYDLQKNDTEPPEISGIRQKMKSLLPANQDISREQIQKIIESLRVFIPGFISVEGARIGIQGSPDKVMDMINRQISDVPNDLQKYYLNAFNQ